MSGPTVFERMIFPRRHRVLDLAWVCTTRRLSVVYSIGRPSSSSLTVAAVSLLPRGFGLLLGSNNKTLNFLFLIHVIVTIIIITIIIIGILYIICIDKVWYFILHRI